MVIKRVVAFVVDRDVTTLNCISKSFNVTIGEKQKRIRKERRKINIKKRMKTTQHSYLMKFRAARSAFTFHVK